MDFLQTQIRRNNGALGDDENFNVAKKRLKALRSTINHIKEQREKEATLSQALSQMQESILEERARNQKRTAQVGRLDPTSESRLVIRGLFSEVDADSIGFKRADTIGSHECPNDQPKERQFTINEN